LYQLEALKKFSAPLRLPARCFLGYGLPHCLGDDWPQPTDRPSKLRAIDIDSHGLHIPPRGFHHHNFFPQIFRVARRFDNHVTAIAAIPLANMLPSLFGCRASKCDRSGVRVIRVQAAFNLRHLSSVVLSVHYLLIPNMLMPEMDGLSHLTERRGEVGA
jgi:hypothetical protein